MSLKIGGVDPTKIMVAGTPATKIMIGTGSSAVQAWQAIRQVTITSKSTGSGYRWNVGTAVGAVEIMIPEYGDEVLRFTVDVTCDRPVNDFVTGSRIYAGTLIREGDGVVSRGVGAVTFTGVI